VSEAELENVRVVSKNQCSMSDEGDKTRRELFLWLILWWNYGQVEMKRKFGD
jgi:hypothetical protein